MSRFAFLTDALRDARHSLRMLRARPGFAVAAILPLALGLGAATAMYSVVDGILLRPLPVRHPEELVTIWATEAEWRGNVASAIRWDRVVIGKSDYTALRDRATSFSALAAWSRGGGLLSDPHGALIRANTVRVTASIFDLIGVRPILGRPFRAGEDVLNGPAIALLSWECWQKSYGGDPAIVGRSITFDEKPLTVIGVMPPGVRLDRGLAQPSLWTPAFQSRQDDPAQHNRSYRGMARLAPGISIARASAEVDRILSQAKIAWNGKAEGTGGRVVDYQSDQTLAVRPTLVMLSAAVTLLLLIACVNLAILLFGEGSRRQFEMATRTALGAAPGRLARQLLAESLVIAGLGSAVGLCGGWSLTRVLVAMAPGTVPGLGDIRFDGRVFLFAAGCALLCGIASGLLPVLALLRWRRSLGVTATWATSRSTVGIERVLVGAEVALSLVMLVGSALLGRSLIRLSEVETGFVPDGLLVVELTGPGHLWADSAAAESFKQSALRELRAIPGVAMVSGSNSGLFNGNWSSSPVRVAGQPQVGRGRDVQQRVVLPDYFTTMRVPLVAGRDFSAADNAASARVAIISASEARQDFPARSALGQRVVWQEQEWTVIGVAADVHYDGLDSEVKPTIYIPDAQSGGDWMSYLVRTSVSSDGAQLTHAIHDRLASLNPGLVFLGINPVPVLIQRSYGEQRYRTLLGSLFGSLGVVLTAFGLFGVISRTVARRMREAGIRSALGAPARSLTGLMLRESAIGILCGVAIGIPAAVWLAQALTPYLYGQSGFDPVAYLAAMALFGLAAAVATVPPARRAARVDPARVLRAE